MTTTVKTDGPTADINVTPMADIMIVLLVIFMVMTPVLSQDEVRLPAAANASKKTEEDRTIVVLVRSDGATFLGRERLDHPAVLLDSLRGRLDAFPQGQRVVFLKADQSVPYAQVERILDLCRGAGAEQLALMADRGVGD